MVKCTTIFLLLIPLIISQPVRSQEKPGYSEEIENYVSFLKTQEQEPVEYIMTLFKTYDIVILCERHHGEFTQYDLIYDIVCNEGFKNKVGNVFTEIGTRSMNGFLHDFMFKNDLTESEINEHVLYLYRNLSWSPLWEKYNFFDFLGRLYSLNNTLPDKKKIQLYFSDMPFSWENMNREKYQQFMNTIGERDRTIVNNIIEIFDSIQTSQHDRCKALIIMNYRHGFNDFYFADGEKGDNVGRYLFEALPGQVSNVMINSLAPLESATDQDFVSLPIHSGKWDAAFKITGNHSLGFDFLGSPFGADYFDYFPFWEHKVNYQEVFTGFIFYKPLKEHILIFGIPNLFGNGYDEILLERMAIYGKPIGEDNKKDFIQNQEKIKEFSYDNMDEINKMINQWLIRKPAD